MALSAHLLSVLGLALATYYLASWIRSSQRLAHIPGPPGWGLSIVPWMLLHTKPDMMDQYYQLSKKYGPLVRVGPNTLITSDADTLRKISAPQSTYRRSMNYYAMRLNPGKDHVFSTRDEAVHNELRKKMAAGYSGKENLTLEDDINESIGEFCDLMDRKYISTAGDIRPVDLATKIEFLVLDIISKVAFDHKFYDLRDDNDNHRYVEEIHNLLPNVTWTAPVPGFVKFMTDIGLLGYMAKFADGRMGVEKVKRLAQGQVALRFEADGSPKKEMRNDMLASFIRHGLSQEQANEESILNLTAGSDTTATTMRSILLNVMTNPRLYRLLVDEIDQAITRGTIPPLGEISTEEQAHKLPLLQATIREGLRWHPAVAAEMSKTSPPEGDTICGFFVPGGTKVGMSMKAAHRNETLFGPDPDAFRPQRWLLLPGVTPSAQVSTSLETWSRVTDLVHPEGDEKDPQRLYAMLRNNELIFGSGRFQCLGKPVALMELNKIFIELLRRYEFQLMDVLKPWDSKACGTHLQKDMWVTVRRRVTVR